MANKLNSLFWIIQEAYWNLMETELVHKQNSYARAFTKYHWTTYLQHTYRIQHYNDDSSYLRISVLNKNTWGVKKVRGQEKPATKSSDIT